MEHNIPLKEVTKIKIHVNQDDPLSYKADILNKINGLAINKGEENYIELEFDNVTLNKSKDFRPHLPLVIKW